MKPAGMLAKDKPKVRGKYNEYLKKRRQYGIERGAKSLFEAVQ